jgi:hypothetical protein
LALSFAVLLVGCDQPASTISTPRAAQAPAKVNTVPSQAPLMNEQELMTAFAADGSQALSSLNPQADVHHGATWFQGSIPAGGSTAYLYLGKLGETGASTLRFVIRYEGKERADLGNCSAIVDGTEVGSFVPAPNRVDQPADGMRQLADIHFDEVRPIVLAMINGQSAVIRTTDGKEIRLDRAALDEMRRVLSAYLHLQGGPP